MKVSLLVSWNGPGTDERRGKFASLKIILWRAQPMITIPKGCGDPLGSPTLLPVAGRGQGSDGAGAACSAAGAISRNETRTAAALLLVEDSGEACRERGGGCHLPIVPSICPPVVKDR